MAHEVYAGGWEIAGRGGMNKSIARFPDVCLSPPSPPAGPIPIPYPNTAFSTDLKKGSKKVKLGGKPAALKNQSFYKPSVLGDEAATKSFGGNIITKQTTGKTFFQAWSFDVKFEGKNVCRHFDITTSNHASSATTTAPSPAAEAAAVALLKEGKCPCCEGPIHENQKDASGTPYEPQSPDKFYEKKAQIMEDKFASIATDIAEGVKEYTKTPEGIGKVTKLTRAQRKKAREARETIANAGAIDPPCDNIHDRDDPCGVHLEVTRPLSDLAPPEVQAKGHSAVKSHVRTKVLGFTKGVRKQSIREWEAKKGEKFPKDTTVCHKTPIQAGGCPVSQKNLVPKAALSTDCKKVEDAQTLLQDMH